MMACKDEKKLRRLVDVCVRDELFKKTLSTSVFRSFVEILNNFRRGKFSECLSSKTRKKAVGHRRIIKTLVDKRLSLRKRKRIFLKTKGKFRNFCHSYLLKDFFSRCLE